MRPNNKIFVYDGNLRCACFLAFTPMRGHRCMMGISWRVVSFMWLLVERGLRSCPTMTCSSPKREEREGLMGKHQTTENILT